MPYVLSFTPSTGYLCDDLPIPRIFLFLARTHHATPEPP